MQITDDIHDALDLWERDDTQWILTNGTDYAVCIEVDGLQALALTRWYLTSPEELERHLAQA
jgi:hypothetical protein